MSSINHFNPSILFVGKAFAENSSSTSLKRNASPGDRRGLLQNLRLMQKVHLQRSKASWGTEFLHYPRGSLDTSHTLGENN